MALLVSAIAIAPLPALANSWTPLVSTVMLHLFIGNFIIGYIEGWLLARWFQLPRFNTSITLILANYASAWAGLSLAGYTLPNLSFITLENIHIWSWILAAILFFVTLLVEYPFFRFCLRKQSESATKTLQSLITIHSVSYLLVAIWYVASSQTSLLAQLDRVPVSTLDLPATYQLYFQAPNGEEALKSDLTGANATPISTADFHAQLSEFTTNFASGSESGDRRLSRFDRVLDQPIPKLTQNSDWDYYIRTMSGSGIAGLRDRDLTQFDFEFTLETPFASWPIRHATHIDGDFVVFQLGYDQICILHPHDRVIALIARGTTPFVMPANAS